MNNKGLLYTVRNFYENRSKTGVIITLSAMKDNGEWSTVRAYVPYKSIYDDSATADIVNDLGGVGGRVARVHVPKERKFDEEE